MSISRKLRGQIEEAKRRTKQAIKKAQADAARNPDGVNATGRVNIVSASNVGQPGSSQTASVTQRVHIRQANGQTYEEIDETRTTESS
jgi:hypothetical protein